MPPIRRKRSLKALLCGPLTAAMLTSSSSRTEAFSIPSLSSSSVSSSSSSSPSSSFSSSSSSSSLLSSPTFNPFSYMRTNLAFTAPTWLPHRATGAGTTATNWSHRRHGAGLGRPMAPPGAGAARGGPRGGRGGAGRGSKHKGKKGKNKFGGNAAGNEAKIGKKVKRTMIEEEPDEIEKFWSQKQKVSRLNWKKGPGAAGATAGAAAGGGEALLTRPTEGELLQCEHFDDCPGCTMDRDFGKASIAMDASAFCESMMTECVKSQGGVRAMEDAIAEGKCTFQVHVGKHHEWRTQAKLAVTPQGRWSGVQLGLFGAGSHKVVPIPKCRVHHPAINRAVVAIEKASKKVKCPAYDEETMTGNLRYVQAVVERRTGKVQLTLVWNAENFRDATPSLQLLTKELKKIEPDLWHSIWANFRQGPGNTIFSRGLYSWHCCSGPEYVKETIGPHDLTFFFSPQLFRQSNLDEFEKIVQRVEDWTPRGAKVCELYSGVGILGLNAVVDKAEWARCSDVNDVIPRSFSRTQRLLPQAKQQQVSYDSLTAEESLDDMLAEDADVLIVDPPRKGLGEEVLETLVSRDRDGPTGSVRRIIYVSCGFEAFKRDAAALVGAGWLLKHAEGYMLFPGSDHIETLAIFDR